MRCITDKYALSTITYAPLPRGVLMALCLLCDRVPTPSAAWHQLIRKTWLLTHSNPALAIEIAHNHFPALHLLNARKSRRRYPDDDKLHEHKGLLDTDSACPTIASNRLCSPKPNFKKSASVATAEASSRSKAANSRTIASISGTSTSAIFLRLYFFILSICLINVLRSEVFAPIRFFLAQVLVANRDNDDTLFFWRLPRYIWLAPRKNLSPRFKTAQLSSRSNGLNDKAQKWCSG